jgi:uncharacterized OsmC-like protein
MSEQTPHGRTFNITAEARTVSGMKKEAHIRSRDTEFTIQSDEGAAVGGEGSAPTPMQYFVAGVAF